jgi:hypothetical protein
MEQYPCEIFEHILSYLPLESLSMVWDVNRRMRNVLGYRGAPFFTKITLENIMDLVNTHRQSPLAEFLVRLPRIVRSVSYIWVTYLGLLEVCALHLGVSGGK